MKHIKRATAIGIALVIGISVMIVLMSAVKADKESEAFLKETDQFIAKYEAKAEAETHKWIKVEATNEKVTEGSSSDINRNGSRSFGSADTGTGKEDSTAPAETLVSVEELAAAVIDGKYGNGEERQQLLGERYAEVQAYIDANYTPPANDRQINSADYYADSYGDYSYPANNSSALNPEDGINYYYGVLETYYNLDMSGVVDWMHSLGYEGDYWVRYDGVKMFGNYVMVAADYDYEPKGTITETSLGLGIVCDTGEGGWGWHDIAVDW